MNDLEARVARLELRLRNWKRLAIAAVGGLACLAFVAAAPEQAAEDAAPEKLRVESLTVGDPEKARIEMTTQPDGSFLILYDENGKQRWRIAAKGKDPYWQLRDPRDRIVHKVP